MLFFFSFLSRIRAAAACRHCHRSCHKSHKPAHTHARTNQVTARPTLLPSAAPSEVIVADSSSFSSEAKATTTGGRRWADAAPFVCSSVRPTIHPSLPPRRRLRKRRSACSTYYSTAAAAAFIFFNSSACVRPFQGSGCGRLSVRLRNRPRRHSHSRRRRRHPAVNSRVAQPYLQPQPTTCLYVLGLAEE